MGGSSLLFPASSIGLDPCLQFLTRAEGHDPAGCDRDLFAGLGVAARALVLRPQVEVAEAGELDLGPGLERLADLLEEQVDEFLGLTLVETQLLEQGFRHLGLGQRHRSRPLLKPSKGLIPEGRPPSGWPVPRRRAW